MTENLLIAFNRKLVIFTCK